MEIVKVLLVGVLGAVTVIMLRRDNAEFALLAAVSTGLVIAIFAVSYLTEAVSVFSDLATQAGISDSLLSGVLKIVGIGYLTEYSSAICAEAGSELISKKVAMAGKLAIFLMSLSVIRALLEVLTQLINIREAL